MRVLGFLILGPALTAIAPDPVAAADRRCLSQDEQRAMIASRKAVPLGRAMKLVQAKIGGDVVKARLCRQDHSLVYMLTVLGQSGKVTQAQVNATDGQWLGGS